MAHILNTLSISNHFVLPDFTWKDIPQIVLLTGANGAGKTKLLEAINNKIIGQPTQCNIDLHNTPNEKEFGFVKWQQNISGQEVGSYAQMHDLKENFTRNILTNLSSVIRDNNLNNILIYLKKHHNFSENGKTEAYYNSAEFISIFREAWVYAQEITFNSYIGKLFINYQNKHDEYILNSRDGRTGETPDNQNIRQNIGNPPWEIINNLFEKYEFKYRVNSPISSSEKYTVKFTLPDNVTKHVLFPHLSSGEQMIVTLILWAFNENLSEIKKLLIMDEPDAHLHPQMALMFKEILSDVLVKEFGIQVIITTHSPTTLCWFPEESIYLMDKNNGVVKSPRDQAMNELTSGLVLVQENLRVVLVEDEDDRKFHQSIYDTLVQSKKITPTYKLQFKPVGTNGVNSGGKTNVINACSQWLNYTDKTNVSDLIYGLVDKDNDDNSNLPSNVLCLGRYCHENYLASPLVLFTLLVQEQEQDTVRHASSIGYLRGEELKFKTNQISNIQDLTNYVLQQLKNVGSNPITMDDLSKVHSCEYINGVSVSLPQRLLNESGKDFVLKIYKEVFSSKASNINLTKLLDQMIKTHLIPIELKEIYKQLSS